MTTLSFGAAFNIDFVFTGGTIPSSTFGGDAGQVGIWSTETAGGTGNMTDILGVVTSTTFNGGGFNEFVGGGDPLYEDLFRDRAAFDQVWQFEILNLDPGEYMFWLYAGPSGSGEFSVESDSVTTNYSSISALTSSAIPVTVTAGNRVFFLSDSSAGDEGVAALQIVPIPEPSIAALSLIALPLALRRRRS
ncbi:MAG: hypothetical protein AAGA58_08605 [Verrucomicrobiota bacterium]